MDKITLNASSKESCAEQIRAWLERMNDKSTEGNGQLQQIQQTKYGLIIDGQTLQYALEYPLALKFLLLAKSCQVVVCCRAAPVQKASVVRLVREELGVMTLAIGDGANDVSMIQVADIGVGISGQEGMQAVQASDFAIGRFRFLVRLLLVHGHWCYDRISKLILYFFYKNMMFVMVLFWFQLYNGFSGSNAINDLNLVFFNLIFTALPPIISGIWDQDVSCETLLKKPYLYKQGQESELYSRKLFCITMADGIFQSLVIFFSAFLVYYGTQTGLFTVGITLHQCAVIVASLQIAIETNYWTIIHGVVLGLSVLLSFLWCIVYSVFSPTLPDYYVAIVTMGTADFWMLCILTAFVSMLPRFLVRTLQQSLWPTEIQKARVTASDPAVSLIAYEPRTRKFSLENNIHPQTSGITV
ncbi:probable phospholipid-transporting ATPase VA [Paramuricea clavata]|uniref:Probable phospholipid-transporting ATPase VA, partial n=1 Tax=Paramuricea clavata TaxID=317549 RepID=A0A6S7KLG1_PARCT|nr:probable phospholipid-transporting ATPase VA [Paramuricea clavata]